MTVGGCGAVASWAWLPPSMFVSSSLTMPMTCCGPVSDLQHVGAGGALAHDVDELAHDAEVYVRLQQRNAHLAQGLIEVLLAYGAVAGEAAENALEFVAERVEHKPFDSKAGLANKEQARSRC